MRTADCFKNGLLKRIKPDPDNAKRSLVLSKKNLDDASENLKIKCHRVVMILSYTAMFHAARGILFRDGIKERSHECVPIYLREKYPDMEKYANILDSYRRFRHEAIYGLDFDIDEKEAESAIEAAKDFLREIKALLGDTNSRGGA